MERREMCGVFFTTLDRDDEDGFDIQIDNPSSVAVAVNVNLADSKNVRINQKALSHNIHLVSDLVAEVMVPAKTGPKQIILPVDVIDDEAEMALALEVIPGPKVDTIVEPCGIVSYVRSLPSLKGFEFSIDNPTTKVFESVTVTFVAENVRISGGPGAITAGNVVTYKGLAAGKKGVLLSRLPTATAGRAISCTYKLDAKEAAKPEPEVIDTKTLANGSTVEVVALPGDGGYEFRVTNTTGGLLDYTVNFKGSKNLSVDAMHPAELASALSVSAQKVPTGTRGLVVARLVSIDPKVEDELAYSVESTQWVKAEKKEKKEKPAKKVTATTGASAAGSGASASASSSSASKTGKTGLIGRPGRSETQTLKCGMIVKSVLLENLAGYTVDVSNPTDTGYKMLVDFVKLQNVEVVSEGTGVQKSETTVQIEVPAGAEQLIIAALPSVDKGKSIAMEYAAKVAVLK